jgi:Leucine-rich repeat (LRR) protein
MELRHVDLSFNNLTVLPALSATAKKKLRVLIVAGNRITSLHGTPEE